VVQVILLNPVHAQTKGGYPVVISAIEPDDEDCLVGKITTPALGEIDAEWNLAGMARDRSDDCGLDLTIPPLLAIADNARDLGARG
jgi:hypothetical protein